MKQLLIINLLICFGSLYSQSRFSITPTLENSFQVTKEDKAQKYIQNDFFTIKKFVFTKPYRFSPLSIGILLNYKLKKDWKLSIGISQGDAMLGYGIYFQKINVFNNPIDTIVSANSVEVNHSGVAITKFPIYLSKIIYNKDSISLFFGKPIMGLRFELFGGISYFRKPSGTSKGGIDLLFTDGADSILIFPNQYLSYESKLFSFRGNNIAYNIGISVAIRTSSKKEIFTLRTYYTYSRKVHAFESIRVTVNNTNFIHSFMGTGTGIYIQLSRSFNFSTKTKNEKDLKFIK